MSGAEEEPPNPNGGNQPPAGAKLRTNVPLPKPLEVEGNLKDNWRKFKQVWQAYEIG